jgi:hypothetical protein
MENTKQQASAYQSIMQTKEKADEVTLYQHYLDCCEGLGIPGVREFLDQMLALDFLIVNEDRHFNNFGVIRNAETLEWLGAAPIFDSGTSLWHDHVFIGHEGKQTPSKPFCDSHTEQIKLVTSFDWLDISVLNDSPEYFESLLTENKFINEERRTFLTDALKTRIEMLDRFL